MRKPVFLLAMLLLTVTVAASLRSASVRAGGGDGVVTGQSVIGIDDRIRIRDTTAFPFSAIAYLELEDEDGFVTASCTGTFIGPDALLTAGHCLWDAEAEDWTSFNIRVIPGKDGGFEPFGYNYAEDWWVPDAYTETGSSDWDWGVIKLPDDTLSRDTGWLSVAVLETEALESPDFQPVIVGYPGDKPEATMWGLIRPAFLTVAEFTLYYDIDTAPGQSGSAIWSAQEGPYLGKIVGIHSQGGSVNSGSRIDQELLDDILQGCELMGCTIAVDDVSEPEPQPEPEPALPFKSYSVAVSRD